MSVRERPKTVVPEHRCIAGNTDPSKVSAPMIASASTPTTAPTSAVSSVWVQNRPRDRGCSYWSKVIRAGDSLPLPSDVHGAVDIDGPFLRPGDVRLFPGDFLFEGEANHHRHERGWTYWVNFIDAAGKLLCYRSGFGLQKAAAKSQGLSRELLAGCGDVAGAIRVAHALRAGMDLPIT